MTVALNFQRTGIALRAALDKYYIYNSAADKERWFNQSMRAIEGGLWHYIIRNPDMLIAAFAPSIIHCTQFLADAQDWCFRQDNKPYFGKSETMTPETQAAKCRIFAGIQPDIGRKFH